MTRIGVFGGQFDPPHNGHVAVASAAVRQLGLDQLVVVVDADPPHREASQLPPRCVVGWPMPHSRLCPR